MRGIRTIYLFACAIRTISLAISSGERIKSIHPLALALLGISGCSEVSGFCAIVMPPATLIPHSASAQSPLYPETITAKSLLSQCCVSERRKMVINF
jgi:hypothetical protein